MEQFWWVIFPYLSLVIMILGSIYRFIYRPIAWGSKSSQILETKMLRWGILLFHWGIIFAFLGHVMGLIIPISFYNWLGVSSEVYHFNSMLFGGLAGLATWMGVALLIVRRFVYPRVRANSSPSDWVSLSALFLAVTMGDAITVVYSNIVGPYEYRLTVGPWIRGVMTFHPNMSLMTHVPLVIQIHVVTAFLLFASVPFTRLVHIWSLPWRYILRAPIQYRSRIQYR